MSFRAVNTSPPDNSQILRNVLLKAKETDEDCRAFYHTVSTPNSDFMYDRSGILIRRSKMDGALQKVVYNTIARPLPQTLPSHRVANKEGDRHDRDGPVWPWRGHTGSSRMYEKMCPVFY